MLTKVAKFSVTSCFGAKTAARRLLVVPKPTTTNYFLSIDSEMSSKGGKNKFSGPNGSQGSQKKFRYGIHSIIPGSVLNFVGISEATMMKKNLDHNLRLTSPKWTKKAWKWMSQSVTVPKTSKPAKNGPARISHL